MKRFLKVLTYFFAILIVFIIFLAVTAKLAENKIVGIALKKISESIDAPVKIEETSFTLLRKFPLATIELNHVLLSESNSLSDSIHKNDTLLNINKVYVSVKTKPLIKGNFEIAKVDIDGANINYLVDTSGKTNFDFLLNSDDEDETDSTSKPLNLTLTDLSLSNVLINFNDSSLKAAAKVSVPKIKLKAKLDESNTIASADGDIVLTNCVFDSTNLFLMNKTDIKLDLAYENDSINIKELAINSDGANINLLGSIILGDVIKTNLQIVNTDLVFDELIKYAPEEMLTKYGVNDVFGKLNVSATVKGNYSDHEMPQVDLNLNFSDGNIITKDYPELKNISFAGKLTNGILQNNKSTQADFSVFHFETEKSKFDISFSILDIDHPKYDIKTELNINVDEFNGFLPDSIVENISGNVIAKLQTKGELPDSIGDDFTDYLLANSKAEILLSNFTIDKDTDLSIRNFSTELIYNPNNILIQNLNIDIPSYNAELQNTSLDIVFKGSIQNMSKFQLDVKSYHLETKGSVVTGYAKLKNLDNPDYEFESKIITDLNEAKEMLPDSIIKTLKGNVELNVKSKATLNLDSLSTQYMDIVFKNSEFNMILNDVYAELYDEPLYTVENLSGFINMNPEILTINNLSGKAAGFEFGVDSTRIENLYNTIIKNNSEKLLVDTRINLGSINYTMFAPFMETDTTKTIEQENIENKEQETTEQKRYSMCLKGVAKVKSFTYDKVLVNDISTLFNITDSVYIIDQFKFSAFNGSMNSSVRYSLKKDNRVVIDLHNIINSMDINKLLTDFDDFEEYYEPAIRSENLSGLFSTDLHTQLVMIGDSLVQPEMRVKGDIKLENGGVYDFEPATNLSRFTGIDELDNIKFNTLNSNIFILKNAIYVPETFISSTALNIKAYGMQSFGDDYEYHLQIKLSDILFGKSKKQKRKESKAGEHVEDDRNMREIVSYSSEGKNKNRLDNKDLQGKMKNKIKIKETLLNLRFHPEMVNFDTKVYSSPNMETINNQNE